MSSDPTFEPRPPGVNARPSLERLDLEPTSALQRASETPPPANPSAVQVRPNVGRIQKFNAKPVESGITPSKRASIAKPEANAGVRPVAPEPAWPKQYQTSPRTLSSSGGGGANYSAEDLAALKQRHDIAEPSAVATAEPVGPKRPSMVDHWLGEHTNTFDPTNPRHADILQMRNEEMAAEANRIRFDVRSDWSASDLARSDKIHGKGNRSPVKQRLANALMQENPPAGESEMEQIRSPYSDLAPARPKGVVSLLPSPEEEARMKQSMLAREQRQAELEKKYGKGW